MRRFRQAGIEIELSYLVYVEDEDLGGPLPPDKAGDGPVQACFCREEFRPLRLPAARVAQQDKDDDPDDRVVLHVDAQGRVFWSSWQVNLSELARALPYLEEKYGLKMKARGRAGFDDFGTGEWSRLYVLVRADARAPWENVAWVLHVLAEQRLYKVQFAARSPAFARSICAAFDGKLQAFLPTGDPPSLVSLPGGRTRLHLDVEPGRAPTVPKDAAEADVVVLHVEPGVTHGEVVAVLDAVHAAGIERVDFDGVAPPPRTVREAPEDRSDYEERGLMVPVFLTEPR